MNTRKMVRTKMEQVMSKNGHAQVHQKSHQLKTFAYNFVPQVKYSYGKKWNLTDNDYLLLKLEFVQHLISSGSPHE
jgi:hypothetical protein